MRRYPRDYTERELAKFGVEIANEYPHYSLRCKVCSEVWWPSIRPQSGGKLYRGSWKCPRGCNEPDPFKVPPITG